MEIELNIFDRVVMRVCSKNTLLEIALKCNFGGVILWRTKTK